MSIPKVEVGQVWECKSNLGPYWVEFHITEVTPTRLYYKVYAKVCRESTNITFQRMHDFRINDFFDEKHKKYLKTNPFTDPDYANLWIQ